MDIELNENEALTLENLLSAEIEKFIGLSEPQENFIQNINSGMGRKLAFRNFNKENKKLWRKMIKEKQPLFSLYFKFFLNEKEMHDR
jgi:hypothetical protein